MARLSWSRFWALMLLMNVGPFGGGARLGWASTQVAKSPQRIVSCSLATDEFLMELFKPASYHRIVALSPLALHPVYSNLRQQDIPAHLAPSSAKAVCHENIEALLEIKPDMVLLAAYSSPLIARRLGQAGISTYTAPAPRTLGDIEQTIKDLGVALGEIPASEELLSKFKGERATIKSLVVPPSLQGRRIIHVFGDGAVSGSQTLFDSLAAEISIVNQASRHGLKGWSKHSIETLLALNPEILITAKEDSESLGAVTARLKNIPGFALLPALKGEETGSGSIIALPERELGSVSHHILKGVRTLKQTLIDWELKKLPYKKG